MKTPYNEIVNIASIGSQTNPISLNEILRKANDEQLTPAAQNKERVLFLGIDVQQDFMDNGALGVPGAHGDVERMTQFIYNKDSSAWWDYDTRYGYCRTYETRNMRNRQSKSKNTKND